MILDDESPEITNTVNEETTNQEDPYKNLSINELKSRLTAMNIELDTKKHPKSYYVNIYKDAINELKQTKINQEKITNQNKTLRTIGNKIREKFLKIKRKRLDKGTDNKSNNGSQNNRFIVTNQNSNTKSADKSSSFFDSDTKSRFNSIKVSKITFPHLNNESINVENDHKEVVNVDRENLYEIHELDENEYENVRQSGEKRMVESNMVESNSGINNMNHVNHVDDINEINNGNNMNCINHMNDMNDINNNRDVDDMNNPCNVNNFTENNFTSKEASKSKDYEAIRKLSDTLMKLITYNNGGINPLATKYEDINESNKPMTPKENVTWSSRKDVSRALNDNYINNNLNENNLNDSHVNGESSYRLIGINNNKIFNNYDDEKRLQNFLEQQHQQQQQITQKKGLSSKYSSKSQALPNPTNINNFKAPRSSNSMIIVKNIPAKTNSSNSLRRIQLKESIIRTKLVNDAFYATEVSINQLNSNENIDIIADAHSVSYEFVKIGQYAVIFIIGSALAAAFYFAFTEGSEYIKNNPDLLKNILNPGNIIAIVGIISVSLFIAYLIKKNKEISEKENKLVADNCFNGIKENLITKRENGVESPEIDASEFIQVYCDSNNVKSDYFNEKIIPLIRAQCRLDNVVEESNLYVDGVIKTYWRLKSENSNSNCY
jgi:hypothetical protein